MLERLASVCFRHRWRVIALWGVGLVALLTASGAVGEPSPTEVAFRGRTPSGPTT